MTRDLIAEWRVLPLRKMRPKQPPKTVMYCTRLDMKQLAAMREIKKRDGIALAKQVREALAIYFEIRQKQTGNP